MNDPEEAPDPAALVGRGDWRNWRSGRFAALFVAYLLLWVLVTLPALRQAWWYTDDYRLAVPLAAENLQHHLGQGRPGQLLWGLTFLADAPPDGAGANVLLRLFQGALHALVAALVAVLVAAQAGRRAALLAGLPFLVSPHAAEVVLWRSAGHYPAAALLAVLAVALLEEGRELPAVGLLAAAVLTHQLAALAGLTLWCVLRGLGLLVARIDGQRLAAQARVLLAGYLLGGAASLGIARLCEAGLARGVTPAEFLGKPAQLLALVMHYLWAPPFHPASLARLRLGLVAGGLLVLVLRSRRPELGRRACALLLLAGAALTPYLALLFVQSLPEPRFHYTSPLLLAGFWAATDAVLERRALRAMWLMPLFALVGAGGWLTWQASRSYVLAFEADRSYLRDLEERSRRDGRDRICAAPSAAASGRDLAATPTPGVPSRTSAFFTTWSAPPFIDQFSSLQGIEDDVAFARCERLCALRQGVSPARKVRPYRPRELPLDDMLCLCFP